jgi:hypothetical protein
MSAARNNLINDSHRHRSRAIGFNMTVAPQVRFQKELVSLALEFGLANIWWWEPA